MRMGNARKAAVWGLLEGRPRLARCAAAGACLGKQLCVLLLLLLLSLVLLLLLVELRLLQQQCRQRLRLLSVQRRGRSRCCCRRVQQGM